MRSNYCQWATLWAKVQGNPANCWEREWKKNANVHVPMVHGPGRGHGLEPHNIVLYWCIQRMFMQSITGDHCQTMDCAMSILTIWTNKRKSVRNAKTISRHICVQVCVCCPCTFTEMSHSHSDRYTFQLRRGVLFVLREEKIIVFKSKKKKRLDMCIVHIARTAHHKSTHSKEKEIHARMCVWKWINACTGHADMIRGNLNVNLCTVHLYPCIDGRMNDFNAVRFELIFGCRKLLACLVLQLRVSGSPVPEIRAMLPDVEQQTCTVQPQAYRFVNRNAEKGKNLISTLIWISWFHPLLNDDARRPTSMIRSGKKLIL